MDWGFVLDEGMGGRVVVFRIRILRIMTMLVRRFVDTGSSVE